MRYVDGSPERESTRIVECAGTYIASPVKRQSVA
jgi:hypothetical protein